MKSLVLAEKPSVGKEIARVLGCRQSHKSYIEGQDYIVTWALGHLVTLAEPEDYDPKYQTWRLEDLPIIPGKMKLKVLKETSSQFRTVAQLAKRQDIKDLIIATDAGREGELVARWIMEMVAWKKPFKRLWISSQTDQAIKDGFARLQPGRNFDPLYQSAVCRAEADWLIGLNVTRALTSKHQEGLSAGRVQTPTLSMIIEREKEIRSFKPVPYWIIDVDFGSFKGHWNSSSGSRIMEETQADEIIENAAGKKGHVQRVDVKAKSETHPLAYDLTELQRDANKKFGFSAKKTLNTLQRLYETHKVVTYPRTDSRYLTSDMVSTLKARLKSVSVGPYAEWVKPLLGQDLRVSKRIVDDSKVTDHHAIIPTEQQPRLEKLTNDEKKIYDLIVRRFLALFYPNYQFEVIKAEIKVGSQSFLATGRVVQQWGWKQLYKSTPQDEEDNEPTQSLPSLKPNQEIEVKRVEKKKHLTSPPERYTEAELLSQMEKKKLGTPATRADIIEKLLQSQSVDRQGKSLHPTQKAWQLIELVAEELRSADLTAEWEGKLEEISLGKGNSEEFLNGIREKTRQLIKQISHDDTTYKPHNVTGSKCPDCGEFLREVKTKRGKILKCPSQDCSYRRSNEQILLNKRCPQCKKKMELRTGKAGKYAHCRPCNVIDMLDQDAKSGKTNKRTEKSLVQKYKQKETLSSSLGDALKAALQQNKQDS